MALLGDDGRGYDLARKLEVHGVWRTWLGDSSYSSFIPFLSSPSSWEAFMRADESKSRAQIHLQLRARALLFDKASVSLFLRSSSSSSSSSSSTLSSSSSQANSIPTYSLAVTKLNPSYLQLHGDDVYYTLENHSQDGVQLREGGFSSSTIPSKMPSKTAFNTGLRYKESEIDNAPQRFKTEELPETWYNQFIEKYKAKGPYQSSSADRESEKRTSEDMSNYLRFLEKHKKRCIAIKEDEHTGSANSMSENGSNIHSNSVLAVSNSVDDTVFFPETMFPMNSVPDSALPSTSRVQVSKGLEFYGVLDTLPLVMTRNPVMLERLGVRPEYLNMERGGANRGKIGSEVNRRSLSHEQSLQISQKVLARILASVGFEGTTEVPLEVFSQLLRCHAYKLGSNLKVLADSYRKQCSAIELLKMFLKTMGYNNFGPLVDTVKDGSRNFVQQTQQQFHGIQSQMQSQRQNPLQVTQQMARQMHPQMQQQMIQPQNLTFQQQQQLERMRRRQPSTPRSSNMDMSKERPLVQVKLENPPELPLDASSFNALNSRHPQLQLRQQQIAAMSNLHAQPGNQFRQMAALQLPQTPTQSMGVARAPPVKVEGFQELMGGDSISKHDSEETRLTSTSNK